MKNLALDPHALLQDSRAHRLVIVADLKPVAGADRFQPAGFPELGHVIYDAPRADGSEKVCIVDSAPSMANHLETVCLRDSHDTSLVDELTGLPYVRCVTGPKHNEVVVTTFTEGHRLASTYFLHGCAIRNKKVSDKKFEVELREAFGLRDLGKKTHPLPAQWWQIFRTIANLDPNSLVHGILFPQWQIKISRVLTANMEALGAARVTTSGVKFDKLGKTSSGQPIFSKDEETAKQIVATFVIDLSLVRSYGQGDDLGLDSNQKALLVGLALWKVETLLARPFRYRSGCDLECTSVQCSIVGETSKPVTDHGKPLDIAALIKAAKLTGGISDILWPEDELFREAVKTGAGAADDTDEPDDQEA